MFYNRKAQAATELAILGSLIIIAFSFLINYSEKLNRQQSYLQQTFRAALKEAGGVRAPGGPRNSASYTKVVFRRMANVGNPMELGQLQSFSNSSNVLWEDGLSKAEHGVSKYQLNDEEISFIPHDVPAAETTESTIDTFTNNVDVTTTTLSNTNPAGNIITTKVLNAKDTLTAAVYFNADPAPFTQMFTHTLGVDGKYSKSASSSLEKSRSMQ